MSKFKPKVVTTQTVSSGEAKKAIYEQIQTTQQAINTAITEHRVVRFQTDKSNKEIKRTIDNLKGCLLRKPDKDAGEIAVIPPGIEDFCFEEAVDTSIEVKPKSRIVIPKPVIYKP